MNLDAPIPAPAWRTEDTIQSRAVRLVDEEPRHDTVSLQKALRQEFPHASNAAVLLASLKALGEWR